MKAWGNAPGIRSFSAEFWIHRSWGVAPGFKVECCAFGVKHKLEARAILKLLDDERSSTIYLSRHGSN
jgi:hypothetical protein